MMFIEGEEEVGSDSLVELLTTYQRAPRGRRHRDRRLRQLGHRRAGPDHQPARPGPDGRRGPHPRPRRALRHVGRAGARRDHDPEPADRQPPRRRRQRRGRGPASPARPPTWTTPRTGCAPSPAPPRASSGSAPAASSSACGPSRPLSITGLDAPKVDGASNTLLPAARAASACASPPATPPPTPSSCLQAHLEKHVAVGRHPRPRPSSTPARRPRSTPPDRRTTQPARRSRRPGTAPTPVDMGVGGSIPFIAEFLEAFPRGQRAGHRRRGPRHPGPRRQRGPAPRRVRAGRASPRPCCCATSATL